MGSEEETSKKQVCVGAALLLPSKWVLPATLSPPHSQEQWPPSQLKAPRTSCLTASHLSLLALLNLMVVKETPALSQAALHTSCEGSDVYKVSINKEEAILRGRRVILMQGSLGEWSEPVK